MNKDLMKRVFKPSEILANNRGTALITSFLMMTVMVGLTSSFTINSVSELNAATRLRNSTAAFWAAEGGAARFIQNNNLLSAGDSTVTIGSGTVTIHKDDTDSAKRILTVTSSVGGVSRQIKLEFPGAAPDAFSNTISVGEDLTIHAVFAGLDVNQKTRIHGTYAVSGVHESGTFEDKVTGVASNLTTLTYPDSNNNGTSDEFNDFKQFNQNLLSTYPASEVVYIQGNATVTIFPSSNLAGKKVIYVEGATARTGNVNVFFDPTWAANQNITIISTGSVNYIQPLQTNAANSQLNTISWDDYNEGSVFYSTHTGVTYTHDDANYGSVVALSSTTGSTIANGDFNAHLAVAWKEFNYENPLDADGNVPPGFKGLVGSGAGYSSTPNNWYEM